MESKREVRYDFRWDYAYSWWGGIFGKLDAVPYGDRKDIYCQQEKLGSVIFQ